MILQALITIVDTKAKELGDVNDLAQSLLSVLLPGENKIAIQKQLMDLQGTYEK